MKHITPIARIAAVRDPLAALAGEQGLNLNATVHLDLLDAYNALEASNRGPMWNPPAKAPFDSSRGRLLQLARDLEDLKDDAVSLGLDPLALAAASRSIHLAVGADA